MAHSDDRWVEVSKSAFAHEADGLAMLRYVVPKAPPYRAWTNFEFMDNHGQWHEVDALVLGRRRLHLIELKHYTGELRGTEANWIRTLPGGKKRTQRSPLLLTRRKAQRLATRIDEEARKVAAEFGLNAEKVLRALPFVQESVFLHGSPFTVHMPDLAKSGLFGPDGFETITGLPAISTRILEPPTDTRKVDEDLSLIIAHALKNLGIARRTERDAGSWTITGTPLASGDDWQEWAATHKGTDLRGRARIVSFHRGTPQQARAAAHRRMQREFSLLQSMRHEAIVAPRDLVQDDDGNTVIIYPETPGFEPLDLALATHTLTAEQQLTVLTQIAEAVAYAHRNHVAHRGLGPATVLIHTGALDNGDVRVCLADWSWAGRVHSGDTRSVTKLGTPTGPGGAPADEVYQAPEDRWAPDADRLALDVFSLGALAYYLLSGGQAPARDRAELLERLRQEHGLDLAASGVGFVDEKLRALVLQATAPSVSQRMKTDRKSGRPQFGAQQFSTELTRYLHDRVATSEVDPLNPAPGALLGGRFDVVRVLGAGSTARGVLVTDRDDDDRLRVLKVGLDDAATSRLHDEAQVLTELAKQTPPVPGVVELIEGPIELAHRTALLLTNCGDQTLADVVRHTPLVEAQLRAWGKELLDVVVALDTAGITHRDLKPSNLGLAKPEGKPKAKARLTLFDFSLSRAPVEQIEAGTPPYRDPFLGTGIRTSYDSAAERYSAAVVLYEMATATTPVYGDGLSDPRVLDDDVNVTTEDFTSVGMSPARAVAMAGFFRKALARNVKERFDTAAAMRDAWRGVFTAQPAEPAPQPKKPAPAPAPTPIPVVAPSGTYTSLGALAEVFARTAATKPSAMRRQVVELILGSHAQSPDDPFVTYQVLAPLVGVTDGRIAQIFGDFSGLWAKDSRLEATVADLYRRLLGRLESSGGASTPELLARELVGALHTDGVDDPQRTALGVLRLLLASPPSADPDDTEPKPSAVQMVRRHGTGTVAMISTPSVPRKLPARLAEQAEALVSETQKQGAQLVSPAEAEPRLRDAAAGLLGVSAGDVEVPPHTLLRIASVASTEVALSSRDELHARSMPIIETLRILLRGLSSKDEFGRAELQSRLAARFPALTKTLPKRPELDAVVSEVVPGMHWNEALNRYEFAQDQAAASYVPTRHTRPATAARREHGTSDAEYLLTSSRQERTFRALGVPLGKSDEVADALVAAFGAVRVDVTDLLLSTLRSKAAEAGIDWTMILAADAGAVADREGLKGFVAQAIPTVIDAVESASGPVALTDLSTLAAYGQLDILGRWTDLTTPPPHAIWALVPQREEAGGRTGAKVDGTRLPINSPEQFAQIDDTEVTALLDAAPRTDGSTVKEHA
ncbi:protein kinase domain-containing protein [Nocardia cyriacigeorgica]|uniref:protein kinase domain-containing protein n=1 Tax=Nocardia cyriacigeorgica TaxID=135487 RepID=UPI00245511EC|nr:NERD domain-containing protein [Nocardia cyriacigeorgica]